ncbi:hypothetical protein VTO73DRAFT_10271 [Trametes versicolor]
MMQYRNGLIGKRFKSLAQTRGILWITEIHDKKKHLDDLETLIGNLLDAFGDIHPARIIVKEKLQVLAHVLEDIPRFGPAPRYSTETYECFNAIFRLSSVHSNWHQAPSTDIAVKMAKIECVRHVVTGGFWEGADGNWLCAGSNALAAFRDPPLLQHRFGWTIAAPSYRPGRIQLPSRQKQVRKMTEETLAAATDAGVSTGRPGDFPLDAATWCLGVPVIECSGDVCRVGSWVFIKENQPGAPCTNSIARIEELLLRDGSDAIASAFVVVERFLLGSVRHPTLGFPVLRPPVSNTKTFEVILSTAVLFVINVQHDCEAACGSSTTGTRIVRQERQEIELREAAVKHNTSCRYYLVSTHALHNAAELCRHLPRSLFDPVALYSDRQKRHQDLAAGLRVTEAEKRVRTQKKRQETMQKKAQLKNSTESAPQASGPRGVAHAAGAAPASLDGTAEVSVNEENPLPMVANGRASLGPSAQGVPVSVEGELDPGERMQVQGDGQVVVQNGGDQAGHGSSTRAKRRRVE